MPKVTYLLIQSARGSYPSPIAVCGSSVLGHALYDPEHGAHVFRFTQEEWEGGIDRQIAENKHRSFGKWIVRAEVEPDLAVPEEALKARIAELEAELEPYRKALAEAQEDPMDQLPPAAESETPPVDPANPPTVPPADLNLHPKQLEKLVREANEKGAGIIIEGERTKVKLRDALTAYYAKAA